jgi:sulfur-oxidizing protein SoxY
MISTARLTAAAILSLGLLQGAAAQTLTPSDPWPDLVRDIFHDRAMTGDEVVALEAPVRAEDAAIVPMSLRLKSSAVKSATLVIDQNPAPMAASFTFGEKAGVGFIATRVRVNSYTNVHAVAETQDGVLHSQMKFVKAAGGCSAPAGKNPDEATAHLGEMKYREFKSPEPGRREAQIMIRHPNSSGMQMDQLTHLYIPAHYIDRVEVRQGEDLIFSMEGGISLSEDPNFRFSYAPNGSKTISVEAHDIKGNVFKQEWPIGEAS